VESRLAGDLDNIKRTAAARADGPHLLMNARAAMRRAAESARD
jgi:hypothetical protein